MKRGWLSEEREERAFSQHLLFLISTPTHQPPGRRCCGLPGVGDETLHHPAGWR